MRLVRDDALGPDALALIALSEAELAALYPPEVRFAFSPEELTRAATRFYVAHDELAVGCGGYAVVQHAGGAYAELKRMFVRAEARGRGIAARLLEVLEDGARAEGLPIMRLETGTDSPAAIRAYEKAGYVRRAAFGAYTENGSSVFMEKHL